ncbi:MAG: hypothetical protein HOV80_08625, partial [Polyangiaceae bacterium]|nr:hypothetical protein [Polyangiaceae bacterium]
EPGAILFIGRQAFVVKRVVFDRRLDGTMWWSRSPCSRDYLRVTLSHADGASAAASAPAADAWVYVDRASGETMLQGWWE